jgi:hypothetical protein
MALSKFKKKAAGMLRKRKAGKGKPQAFEGQEGSQKEEFLDKVGGRFEGMQS